MFLLDTHALIWFLDNDSRLPLSTKQQIESAEAIFVSIVSIWEIAIKINIGKLKLKTDFQAIEQNLVTQDISILAINIAAIKTYLSLPLHHRDPFDRILIAQSIDRALTIVSCDIQFDAYPVTRLWDI
ncbi:MAG: type II toxin-antitoxin system VapC family toxin [Waterburya sp.]